MLKRVYIYPPRITLRERILAAASAVGAVVAMLWIAGMLLADHLSAVLLVLLGWA